MKNLKNNIVAAIVAVATIAGFSAFKKVEHHFFSTHWFDVERINPSAGDSESNLKIVSVSTSAPSSGVDPFGCATENPGSTCQAQLDIGTTDPASLQDMSISDARSATGAPAPNYAKDPQP